MRDDEILAKLSPGQRSTIRGLDANPCILGCAEQTAKGLAKARGARPPLVDRMLIVGEHSRFSLNERGLAVKALLEASPVYAARK